MVADSIEGRVECTSDRMWGSAMGRLKWGICMQDELQQTVMKLMQVTMVRRDIPVPVGTWP